tara:strand:- start:174 stop:431 length:258 start_codon:yes stop_codon:yes gene_type:complete
MKTKQGNYKMKVKANNDNIIKLTIFKINNKLVIENYNNPNEFIQICSIDENYKLNKDFNGKLQFIVDINSELIEKQDKDLYKAII